MNSRTIDRAGLLDALTARRGAQFATFLTRTEPDMRKTDNPFFGNLVKVAEVNGVINWVYEDAVNRARVKAGLEPDFSARPRKWGHRIQGTPLVWHKGRLYVELKVQNVTGLHYETHDGRFVDEEDVRPFLRERPEQDVVLRDYAVDSVCEARLNGEVLTVSEFAEVAVNAGAA